MRIAGPGWCQRVVSGQRLSLLVGTSRFCISAWFLLLFQVMQHTKELPMPSRAVDTEFPGTDVGRKARKPEEVSSWILTTINQKL